MRPLRRPSQNQDYLVPRVHTHPASPDYYTGVQIDHLGHPTPHYLICHVVGFAYYNQMSTTHHACFHHSVYC
ncbi:hypothetical protein HYC85_020994 [Camellia sinensis]|uniref:Uncharacterized protein n=1 Tax=Camellia sinensis TaxID=4442 RepID=A0A7J7GH54_CAMSI|nr:hypothetical protein HYC85_020994 [Camellia sinensis]